ncbi:MAG: PIN domain-containing protein [Candidatus Nealsonbacteria bacterium]|nr:PIN domain-containing protein [Candidatus Nealsonbacteria bacterium]
MNDDTIEMGALLRRKTGLNIADSIIGATTINFKFTLITRDKVFQRKIKPLVRILEI